MRTWWKKFTIYICPINEFNNVFSPDRRNWPFFVSQSIKFVAFLRFFSKIWDIYEHLINKIRDFLFPIDKICDFLQLWFCKLQFLTDSDEICNFFCGELTKFAIFFSRNARFLHSWSTKFPISSRIIDKICDFCAPDRQHFIFSHLIDFSVFNQWN